jgi:alkylation response protein AidB-like acyl-CoA dehydrogenase
VPAKRAGILGPLEKLSQPLNGPLSRFTLWLPVASLASVALGIARGAVDALLDLGLKKTPAYSTSTLAGRSSAQMQLGRAEAVLGAARCYLHDSVRKAWDTACGGEMLTQRNKIDIQLAASHALQSAAEVVQLVHQAAGTSAIRREYAFERRFRDVHVLTQHAFASFNRFESVGKLLFGQPTDWPFLTL